MVVVVTPTVTAMRQSWKLLQLCANLGSCYSYAPILEAVTMPILLLQLCANPGSCYMTAATGATDSTVTRLLQQMPPILKVVTPTVTCFNLQD
jgi:hypothetical protein